MKLKNKILLIEDDLLLGSTIQELLTLKGFDSKWFEDGKLALHYLKKNTCDLIISDLMMPSISGEDFFLTIKEESKFNTIPFIMITANINEEIKYKQLAHGVNDYILKPFKLKELIFKVSNLLEFKRNVVRQVSPDPFSKVTIKLSSKDFITMVNDILVKNLKSTINHDDLASLLHISKSTLDKKMRKYSGKNTSQYIREFKLDYAIEVINLGERNIQFLVEETGFNSFSYFSTSFKLYFGVSARDYIKSIDQKKQI